MSRAGNVLPSFFADTAHRSAGKIAYFIEVPQRSVRYSYVDGVSRIAVTGIGIGKIIFFGFYAVSFGVVVLKERSFVNSGIYRSYRTRRLVVAVRVFGNDLSSRDCQRS